MSTIVGRGVVGQVVMIRLDSITVNSWNPNRVPDDLMASLVHGLRYDGWLASQALLVWGTDEKGQAKNIIIDGEHRYRGALQLGFVEGPAVILNDLPEHAAKALTIKMNQKRGSFDPLALGDVLRSINDSFDDSTFGVELGIVDSVELDRLIATTPSIELPTSVLPTGNQSAIEVSSPDLPLLADIVTKPGDIWVLGAHRLLCGDSRKQEDVARLLGDTLINVAFTSPPYASQRKYDESSGFKPIAPEAFVDWFDVVQANVRAHLALDGSWFVNIKESASKGQRHLYVKDLVLAHVRKWGWLFVDEFCWRNTSNGVPGVWPDRFKNAWEPIFHFALAPIKFRPDNVKTQTSDAFSYGDLEASTTGTPFFKGSARHDGLALPSNVIEARPELAGLHSAPFPVALPFFFIRAYSDLGDAVFDPFVGSGTTIIGCEQTGRCGYGIELSPAFCDVTVKRWEAFTGKKATREGVKS